MKVLHITTWFPNKTNPKEALWIRQHIEALAPFVDYKVLHLQVKPSNKLNFEYQQIQNGQQKIFSLPTNRWLIIELVSAFILLYQLLKLKVNKNYEIINFHIAYPNLTYWHLIKKFIKIPVVITEHWSAYHYNFGVKKSLPRIQRIFQQNIPVISVSKALEDDIKVFSNADFPSKIIPNTIDKLIFFSDQSVKRGSFYFMVSQWSQPKKPFIVMEAFKIHTQNNPGLTLKIAGYGLLWNKMKEWVIKNDMKENIIFLGILSENEIASNMRTCSAFVHCSEYETFSVVCAEAISCKCPIIISNTGGVREFTNNSHGILIENNTIKSWSEGLDFFYESWSSKSMEPYEDLANFSKDEVGNKYYNYLKTILYESK